MQYSPSIECNSLPYWNRDGVTPSDRIPVVPYCVPLSSIMLIYSRGDYEGAFIVVALVVPSAAW